jgi:hypothetical protein
MIVVDLVLLGAQIRLGVFHSCLENVAMGSMQTRTWIVDGGLPGLLWLDPQRLSHIPLLGIRLANDSIFRTQQCRNEQEAEALH